MAFSNFQAFISMGTHGAYVWPAYGIFIVAILALHISAAKRCKTLNAQLNALKQL